MSNEIRAYSITIANRNGNRQTIYEPLWGTLKYSYENGRIVIKRVTFWGWRRIIIPSIEDSVDVQLH